MKVTERDSFRVVATLRTGRASQISENLDGWMIGDGVSITFKPRRAGDMIGASLPERWITRDREQYYLVACTELAEEIDKLPYVKTTEIVWDETHSCSYCKLTWEEIDQGFIDQYPNDVDPLHGVGTPLCCEKAQDAWVEENRPACIYETGGTYETPPERCDLDVKPGSEYCAIHSERIAKLEALVQADEFFLTVENDPQ